MDISNNNQKKILLVEDDDNLANVYLARLEVEGFIVRRVPNGEDALASAIEFKPDLVLLDILSSPAAKAPKSPVPSVIALCSRIRHSTLTRFPPPIS